jgi:primary-amine oxidase
MSITRLAVLLLGTLGLAAVLLTVAPLASSPAQPVPLPEKEIIQEFPSKGPMRTAWKVQYGTPSPGAGLCILGAYFKRSPNDDWIKVINDLRLSEIFVPYNNGTRIYDLGSRGSKGLLEATSDDAGPHGTILNKYVIKEIADSGLQWKFYKKSRRGEEMRLWATLGVGNYNYISHYTFRDDGTIQVRMGATGQNFGGHYTTGHMHHGCWRIDLDVVTGENNTVKVVRRQEPIPDFKGKDAAREVEEDFNGGVEGGIDWVDKEFTHLRILSTRKNGHGHLMGYELLPLIRPGTPRHVFNPKEAFSRHDFWVTPYKWDEQYYVQLPEFVKQKRSIQNTDVVVWYQAPMYHIPRDEDGIYPMRNDVKGPRPVQQGVTLTMWNGFDLRPRNLFESTPLYP